MALCFPLFFLAVALSHVDGRWATWAFCGLTLVVSVISQAALIEASKTMKAQVTLLRERSEAKVDAPTLDGLFRDMVSAVINKGDQVGHITNKVNEIRERV